MHMGLMSSLNGRRFMWLRSTVKHRAVGLSCCVTWSHRPSDDLVDLLLSDNEHL